MNLPDHRVVDGVVQAVAPTTTEQRLAKRNELKARSTLLMALPDKHQLKFNTHKDAKSLMEVIEKRFGGNKETKKVQKTLFKQQYENFNGSSSESLEQIHDRLQKLISQLEIFVSAVASVFAASTKVPVSAFPNVDNLSDAPVAPTTAEQRLARKNELKARGTLLMAFLDKHHLKFNIHKDAMSLMEAIEKCTNELVSVVTSVSTASTKVPVSAFPNVDNLSDARTCRNLGANGTTSIGFAMSKVECYNCHKRGHFSRECRSPKDTRNKDTQRRNVPVETSTSNALIASGSKACSKAYATLQSHYDQLTNDLRKSQFDVLSYKTCLESVEARLVVYQQNENVFEEDIKLLKLDVMLRDNALVELRKKFKKAEQERDDSESDVSMPTSSVHDRYQSSEGYHAVPPPYIGTFLPFKPDLVFHDALPVTETVPPVFNVELSTPKPNKEMSQSHRPSAPIIEDWVSDLEDKYEVKHSTPAENLRKYIPKSKGHRHSWTKKACFICKSLNHLIKDCDYYKKKMVQKPVRNHTMKGTHQHYARMTHSHLNRHVVPIAVVIRSRFVPLTAARPVTTAVPYTNVKHQRPAKHVVNKPHTKCIVLSSDFKLPDDNHVLRVPRENDMYNVDLKNIVPLGDLTCLFAKATLDESNLWHRRLGHINFKIMNKLVKGNLVRGLPSKVFENNHTCVACKKGKKHRASCKSKPISSISQPLQRLHMDLFRPTFVKSLNKKSYCLVVTDDYSRFSWVFFLATKDETSTILKTFITGIENQINHKVKIIRSDDGTKFKNHDLNQFCRMKGIKREFSVARTPQQNGNAKIKLVLVSKPHNKTPYELLLGRTPSIGFMKPSGCPVTILNTLDPLGSGPTWPFDINTLTQSMNYQPVVTGNQPTSSADPQNIDADATFEVKGPESEVYVPPSSSEKTKKHDDKTKREAKGKSPVDLSTGFRNLSEEFEDFSSNTTSRVNAVSTPVTAFEPNSPNNTNTFNAAGPSNSAVSLTFDIGRKSSFVNPSQYPDDPNMPALEDITYSDDEEDVGVEVEFSNLETSITVSIIPTTRVHKDHHVSQIIGDLSSAPQTKSMTRVVKDQEEPKRVHQELKDPSWIEAMQKELLQFKLQKVWVLVDLPKGKGYYKKETKSKQNRTKPSTRQKAWKSKKSTKVNLDKVKATKKISIGGFFLPITPVARIEAIRLFLAYASFMGFMVYQMDVKSVFIYGTIEEEVYVCQPPGFEDPYYPDKVYKVVKALYGLHQAPKAWYETLANYLLENGFQKGKINQTLFIKRQKGDILLVHVYVDDIIFGSTNKDLCKAFEKLMKDKFQMSSMGELTFFLGLQVKQKEDGIFISQDKYVAKILRKFGLIDRKSASTPIDTKKPLLKDPDDIMFAICACARFQVTPKASHLHAIKRIFRYLKGKPHLGLWYPKHSPFYLVAYSDSDYDGASLDRESKTGGCQFLGHKKFWSSVSIKKANDVVRLQVLIDRRKVIITEDTIRQALRLDDAVSVDYLPNKEIFAKLARMGGGWMSLKQRYITWIAQKVLSMQDTNEAEPAEVEEVIKVVTAAKLMTEVVTTTATTITAAQVPKDSAPRRKKGVVIHEPEETATASVSVHSEAKFKDKGKGILVEEPKPLKRQAQIEHDEAFARELEAELNANINWSDVMDQVKRKEKQDNTVMRYQALKRKPLTEAHERKNMMIYLKNMAGFKMEFFRGMTYTEIRPIFEKHYTSIQAFLEKGEKEIEEEGSKRKSESSEQRVAKKQRIYEEVEELMTHLQIVADDDDDVFTEATPLATKVPVVDYQIHNEDNKPYYKIIRADGTYKLFLSFITILKNFNREDLEILWQLIQERFQSLETKNFLDDFLLNTLKTMFEKPNVEARI
nr:hypothetical protein [Tanacetum cinerariifolium]